MTSGLSKALFKVFIENEFQFDIYQEFMKEISKLPYNAVPDVQHMVEQIIETKPDVKQKIDNFLFTHSYDILTEMNQNSKDVKNSKNYFYQTQMAWEKKILKSINGMCLEFQITLIKKRPEREVKEMREKWNELSTISKDLGCIRPVYSAKDFLEVLTKMKFQNCRLQTNLDAEDWIFNWGLIQVPLPRKSLQELRIQFHELAIGQRQVGVDDIDRINYQFEAENLTLANMVIKSNNAAASQEFAKRGCQFEHRRELWYRFLGISVQDAEKNYYHQLKEASLEYDLLIDSLIFMDVKLTTTNNDVYFVFEDYLYQILLPLTRDVRLLSIFDQTTANAPHISLGNKVEDKSESVVNYPPSGLIPIYGFSMLAAPLCYFIDDPIELYYVFRDLYLKYFHNLFIISDHPQGILSLCILFETLLQSLEPDLFYYLKNINIQPLRLAFKWLLCGFSGYLAADQVLLLWDRVLAYESMELLPVAAVSIFSFRKSNLLNVKSQTAAEGVLADLTTLQVIPLIQLTLFSR